MKACNWRYIRGNYDLYEQVGKMLIEKIESELSDEEKVEFLNYEYHHDLVLSLGRDEEDVDIEAREREYIEHYNETADFLLEAYLNHHTD